VVNAGDITLCPSRQLIVLNGSCFYSVANSLGDITICELIKKPDLYSGSDVSHISLDRREQGNENAFNNQKLDCVRGAVVGETDAEICNQVQDKFIMDACFLLLSENNPSIDTCMRIESDWYRDLCLRSTVPKVGTKEDCKLISDEASNPNSINVQFCELPFEEK